MTINITELNENIDYIEYLQLLTHLTTINPESISHFNYLAQLNAIKNNPNHKIFIAICDSIVVGSATLLIENKFIHNLSSVGHIEDVVVHPDYRNKGIAKKILNHIHSVCDNLQCYKIILDCSKEYVNFYEKNGFTKNGIMMSIYL